MVNIFQKIQIVIPCYPWLKSTLVTNNGKYFFLMLYEFLWFTEICRQVINRPHFGHGAQFKWICEDLRIAHRFSVSLMRGILLMETDVRAPVYFLFHSNDGLLLYTLHIFEYHGPINLSICINIKNKPYERHNIVHMPHYL